MEKTLLGINPAIVECKETNSKYLDRSGVRINPAIVECKGMYLNL